MVRVVIDTNVLVSTLIHDAKPRKLLLELLNKHTVILFCQILAELADVAGRDKFHIISSQIEKFFSIIVKKVKLVTDTSLFKEVLSDPDDDVVLNAAYRERQITYSRRQPPFSTK